ncbi:NAD(+) diphosphatase [Fulvimarina sp. 2208YS6-2-32]|uniref:NAD(+) diphosphatase n=1 Tax=Fulvimarina uroteuthidis TaxID=3098149 RepID=A0ABU5HXI5_9HYPH|nr:NAD(+) diphosphatase [Fulvimarina sp. 2208YS6-2-32]MDY8107681.1 NAD(+) diphosphatase [Fulvimarina sp. 2208YS6-2-32]
MSASTDRTIPPANAPLGFATNSLDRSSEERTAASLGEALAHADPVFFLQTETGFLCDLSGPAPEPRFARDRAAALADLDHPDMVLLGYDDARVPFVAVPTADDRERPEHIRSVNLRSLASQGVLDPETEGRLAQARHLLLWHGDNHFCARCGGPTVNEASGVRRQCTRCAAVIFPRTNPVSIMLIHDDAGRCILGRQPHFPQHSWSCLAGFVEAAETLESAVIRETREEAGIEVGDVRYLFSQPWPFSNNLMLGFMARAKSHEIRFDSNELEACRWFEREEVRTMLEGTHPDGLIVPPPLAIAHHLIRAFVDGDA